MGQREQRFFPRIQVNQRVLIAGLKKPVYLEITDISIGGVSFSAEKPVPEGTRLFLNFPRNEFFKGGVIEIKVLRCFPVKDQKIFKIAASFVNSNLEFVEDILKLTNS